MGAIVFENDLSGSSLTDYHVYYGNASASGGVLRCADTGGCLVQPLPVSQYTTAPYYGPLNFRFRFVVGALSAGTLAIEARKNGSTGENVYLVATSSGIEIGDAGGALDTGTAFAAADVVDFIVDGAAVEVWVNGVLRCNGTTTHFYPGVLNIEFLPSGSATSVSIGAHEVEAISPYLWNLGTESGSASGITPNMPTHRTNDIIIYPVESRGEQAVSLTTANGFTQPTNSPQNTGTTTSGTRLTIFGKRATSGSESAPVIADPGDHIYTPGAQVWRGAAESGDWWHTSAGGVKASASTSFSVPGVTTTVDRSAIIGFCTRQNDASGAGFSALSVGQEIQDGGTTQGDGGGIGSFWAVQATAGATSNPWATGTVSNSVAAMMTIALAPVSSGGITVDITGVSATGQAGAMGVSGRANVPVTGVEGAGAAGDLVARLPALVALTGVDGAGSAGALQTSAGASTAVTGVQGSGAAGDFQVSGTALAVLAGAVATGEVGTLTPMIGIAAAITGVEAAGAAGTPQVSAAASTAVTGAAGSGHAGEPVQSSPMTAQPPGASGTGSAGDLAVSGSASTSVPGAGAVGAAGDIAASAAASVALSGVSADGQAGTVTVELSATLVAISGAAGAGQAGDLVVTGDANVPVTGAGGSGLAGDVAALISATVVQLTGVSAQGGAGTINVAGHALVPVTGVAAAAAVGNLAAVTAILVSVPGVTATGEAGELVITASANVPLTGVEAQAAVGALLATIAGGVLPNVPAEQTIVVQGLSRTIVLTAQSRTITLPGGSRTIILH